MDTRDLDRDRQRDEVLKDLVDNVAKLAEQTEKGFAAVDKRFAQADARADARFDKMDKRFAQVDTRLDQADARADARFDKMDKRFAQVDARLDQVDVRFDQVDARLDKADTRFDQVDARLDKADARFDQVERKVDRNTDRLNAVMQDTGALRGDRLEAILRDHLGTVFRRMYGGLFQAGSLTCVELFTDRYNDLQAQAAVTDLGLQDHLDLYADLRCDLLARVVLPTLSFLVVVQAAIRLDQERVEKVLQNTHRLSQSLMAAERPEPVLPCVVGHEFRDTALRLAADSQILALQWDNGRWSTPNLEPGQAFPNIAALQTRLPPAALPGIAPTAHGGNGGHPL